jgi:hypothetical protein
MSSALARLILLPCATLALLSTDASGLIVYRIGRVFSPAERDSLRGLGFDLREIDWSFSAVEDGLDPGALAAGSVQPEYFDEDENIAATALGRGGWISVSIGGRTGAAGWGSDHGLHVT